MNMNQNHYSRLLIMSVLSFISMYILMYSMVNVFGNVFNSLNEFYMAAIMTAPMVVFELLLMGAMYQNKRLNVIILAVSLAALAIFFLFIRQQTAITDKQFLRSMIPHHAGAILMCQQAPIQDPEIKQLCQTIIASQQEEIDQMKAKLQELEK
ncbi:MAG: DUF305 domain-containing protein [Anaerolineales bacterium]